MTFRPREIRRSMVESPSALTSTTPGMPASASSSCGVGEWRKVVWKVEVSAPRESPRTEPWMRSSPWFSNATSSQTSCTSPRRWELMKIVRPSPLSALITSRTSAMPRGSNPEVGSSRMRSSGSLRSACAIERRQVSVELRRLNHRADAGESPGRLLADVDAEQCGAAAGGSDQVRHQFDRRGLPGAVRAKEPEGRALRDREFEGLQGREVTVVLAQPLQVDRGLAGDRLRAGGLHGHRDISRYT